IGKRDGLGRAVGETHAGTPRDARRAAHVDVAGRHVAELLKGLGHRASPRTDIDDAGRRSQIGAQQGGDDLSSSAEPPVGVFDADVLVVEATLHRAPREARPAGPDSATGPAWGSVDERYPGRPNVADRRARSARADRPTPGDTCGATSVRRQAG